MRAAADNGVISAAFTQDAFKEGLLFCKKLCDAGLLAPESFTRDRTQLKAEMNADEEICGIVLTGVMPDKAIVDNIWGKPNNIIWNAECMPFISSQWLVMRTATALKTEENKDTADLFDQHCTYDKPYEKSKLLGTPVYTQEETESLSMIQSVTDSCEKESMTAFATGDRSITEWNGYLLGHGSSGGSVCV